MTRRWLLMGLVLAGGAMMARAQDGSAATDFRFKVRVIPSQDVAKAARKQLGKLRLVPTSEQDGLAVAPKDKGRVDGAGRGSIALRLNKDKATTVAIAVSQESLQAAGLQDVAQKTYRRVCTLDPATPPLNREYRLTIHIMPSGKAASLVDMVKTRNQARTKADEARLSGERPLPADAVREAVALYDQAQKSYPAARTLYEKANFLEEAGRDAPAAKAFAAASALAAKTSPASLDGMTSVKRRHIRCLFAIAYKATGPERAKAFEAVMKATNSYNAADLKTLSSEERGYWIDALNIVSGANSVWRDFGKKVVADEALLKSWRRLELAALGKKTPDQPTAEHIETAAVEITKSLGRSY